MTCNLSRAGNLRWKLSFWISFWTQSSLLACSGLLYPCVYVRRNIRASAMSSVPACSHRLVLSSITGTRALRSLYNDISCLLFEVDATLWRMRCEKSSLFFFFNCNLSFVFHRLRALHRNWSSKCPGRPPKWSPTMFYKLYLVLLCVRMLKPV